jgi:hypothetical protein
MKIEAFVSDIQAAGVDLRLVEGKLQGKGIENLTPDQREKLKALKAEIVRYLSPEPEPTPKPSPVKPSPEPWGKRRRTLEPWRKASFRAACGWILPRLEALKAEGWTLKELFGVDTVKPPFGRWGTAWGEGWKKAIDVTLEPNGAVVFHYSENGRTWVHRCRPKSLTCKFSA